MEPHLLLKPPMTLEISVLDPLMRTSEVTAVAMAIAPQARTEKTAEKRECWGGVELRGRKVIQCRAERTVWAGGIQPPKAGLGFIRSPLPPRGRTQRQTQIFSLLSLVRHLSMCTRQGQRMVGRCSLSVAWEIVRGLNRTHK